MRPSSIICRNPILSAPPGTNRKYTRIGIHAGTDVEDHDQEQEFMRVLLTGSDGFISATLSRDLRQAGHQVIGTCYFRAPGGNEVYLDLTDPKSLDNLPPSPFDAIVHTAGIVDQRAPRKLMIAVNAEGTKQLAFWAKANGAPHFIYLSSPARPTEPLTAVMLTYPWDPSWQNTPAISVWAYPGGEDPCSACSPIWGTRDSCSC